LDVAADLLVATGHSDPAQPAFKPAIAGNMINDLGKPTTHRPVCLALHEITTRSHTA
jgi:hypothetical protein